MFGLFANELLNIQLKALSCRVEEHREKDKKKKFYENTIFFLFFIPILLKPF